MEGSHQHCVRLQDTCSDELNLQEDHLADLGVGTRLTITWILKNTTVEGELDSTGSGQGQLPVFCVQRYELTGSIKCRGFLGQKKL
jgi:hypothetical protein